MKIRQLNALNKNLTLCPVRNRMYHFLSVSELISSVYDYSFTVSLQQKQIGWFIHILTVIVVKSVLSLDVWSCCI